MSAAMSTDRGPNSDAESGADIPAVHIALSRPTATLGPRRYVHEADGWRIASDLNGASAWRATDGITLPERLHALAPSDRAAVANWHAKVQVPTPVQGRHEPGPATLSLIGMTGPTRRERGATLDIEHPLAVPASLPPGIAASAPHQFARLSIEWASGARNDSWLLTLPDEQRLLVWARSGQEDGAAATTATTTTAPTRVQTRVRVESEGRVLDPASWREGFAALDRQIAAALDRVGDRWASAEAVSSTRIEGRPALLAAESGIAWGYREGETLDVAPAMHMTGHLRGCLCSWALSWRGVVDIDGARARVRLEVIDDPALAAFERDWDLPWSHDADPAVLPWMPIRLPLRLAIEPVATATNATNATNAIVADIAWAGEAPALVGGVGLRPSARGNGLEWAFVAALEAVTVRVGLSDPWSGRRERVLDWLPSIPLIDWRCDA